MARGVLQEGLDRLQEQQAATVQREQQVRDLQAGLLQERHVAAALTAPPPRLHASPSPVDTPVAFGAGLPHARTTPGLVARHLGAGPDGWQGADGWPAADTAAEQADMAAVRSPV